MAGNMQLCLTALMMIFCSVQCRILHPSDLPEVVYARPGDVNIGIIVPMHYSSANSMCSTNVRGLTNFQKAEAMAFAVNEINGRNDILPNRTLGFYMLDDCAKDTTALARALHFTQSTGKQDDSHLQAYDVVGVIGSESSRNTVQIADLLSLFQIPVISYISTSPLLSDKDTFPYFSRIVPSDSLQVSVLMDIIIKFNWNYVSIVYEDGSYGFEAFKAFKKLMDKNNKCIAVAKVFQRRVTNEIADSIIKSLIATPKARVVVLVVITPDAAKLFESVTRLGYEGHFTWLGTDGWSIKSLTGYERNLQGSLIIGFYGTYVERFDQYMKYITPKNSTHNPWFREFFEKRLDCTLYTNDSNCNMEENLVEGYLPSVLSGLAIDAVYAFARAIQNILQSCENEDERQCFTGSELLKSLRNVSFHGEHGLVSFDEYGDGSATYSVQTLRKVNDTYIQETIGLWDTSSKSFIKFELEKITWKSDQDEPPISECSEFCKNGYQQVVTKPQCCWYCKPCRVNEISVKVNSSLKCVVCPVFFWPDDSKTKCQSIPVTDLSYDNLIGICITILILILSILILVVLGLYFKLWKLFFLQSKTMSCFILLGNLFSCGTMVAFVMPPSMISCSLIQFGFPLNFAINYCPFLAKMYSTYTALKSNEGHVAATSSRIIPLFLFLVLVQIIIVIITTSISPPTWGTIMPGIYEDYVESACNLDQIGFLASLSYNMILLLVCISFAIQTKNTNADARLVRESKFNNILVYISTVLWLGFIVSYFTTSRLVIKSIILGIMMFVNIAMFVGFLFVPKIIEHFIPHEVEISTIKPQTGNTTQ